MCIYNTKIMCKRYTISERRDDGPLTAIMIIKETILQTLKFTALATAMALMPIVGFAMSEPVAGVITAADCVVPEPAEPAEAPEHEPDAAKHDMSPRFASLLRARSAEKRGLCTE